VDNIKVDLEEIGWGAWQVVVNIVMNLQAL
jgi:hypothetical protein